MSKLSPQLLDAIDRFLDGSMSPAEHADLERQLGASPELRAAFESALKLQRDVDASLRLKFSASGQSLESAARSSGTAKVQSTRGGALRFPKWLPMAAAAAVGVVALVGLYAFSGARPGTVVAAVRPTLASLYQATVDSGFQPEEVCTTREKFADWLGTKFGVALAPREERSDITLVGWSYTTAISPYTGVLLATSDGQPIIVVLDLKVRESGKGPPAVGDLIGGRKPLYVHKAVINGLALYEVSPLDKPRIIDNLEQLKPSGN